ncbi:nucleotidyl transferase AbiEii/AbiGii toxin family protein [Kutzneria sp. 744]|uniref:nucleotidyl transferase AbiEii/AbiGii toxin family protein n=1 Tax=Kutzneria sp. (strain 744) TaxID=345341 RepID=UPI0004ACD012|nr:nucleotidyl transferase AbiEii/AbiGii toxin family protein [Kutzneria sp. 744]
MLEPEELAAVAAEYGVADSQVRRDHLISHVLLALSTMDLPVTFFGGTALARTFLTDPEIGARLSEDIDLYAVDRSGVAAEIDERLPRLLRREFPGTTWDPPLRSGRSVDPGQLVTADGLRVRVQLLDATKHRAFAQWPASIREVSPRYRDINRPIELRVPTLMSFAGMKTAAWLDRSKARDLYDLWGLAMLGALTAETADRVRRITGATVAPYGFRSLPSALDWNVQLAHQTRTLPAAEECLAKVRGAYAAALDWRLPPDPFA